jgi:hypothetical protein
MDGLQQTGYEVNKDILLFDVGQLMIEDIGKV